MVHFSNTTYAASLSVPCVALGSDTQGTDQEQNLFSCVIHEDEN